MVQDEFLYMAVMRIKMPVKKKLIKNEFTFLKT
jgi:hypothetical protein